MVVTPWPGTIEYSTATELVGLARYLTFSREFLVGLVFEEGKEKAVGSSGVL